MANLRLAGDAKRNISPPIGTPMTPPIRNGASRAGLIDWRCFHTDQPCTIRPKAAINAVHWAGGKKCSHTAAATIANANPRKPGDKCCGKGGEDKKYQVDNVKLAHHAPHRFPRGHAAAAI